MPRNSGPDVHSFTIKTSRGEFTADTLRKAKAMAKKADDEYEKSQSVLVTKYDLVRMRAIETAFRIMRAVHKEGTAKHYDWCPPSHPSFKAYCTKTDDRDNYYTLSTKVNCVAVRFAWETTPHAVLVGPSGYVEGYAFIGTAGVLEIVAIAAEGESWCGQSLTEVGITKDHFPELKE